ncbi:MAG TPA: cytidine deaminase, partial [Chlamydiales bacterium]|nr:cytidine deaminase [Chlamydiales bacterium]
MTATVSSISSKNGELATNFQSMSISGEGTQTVPQLVLDYLHEPPITSEQATQESSQAAQEAYRTKNASAKQQIESHFIRHILGSNPFVIDAEKVAQIRKLLGYDDKKLLQSLIPFAQPFARPPISNYHVGAAAMGKSGAVYLGVNLEFIGFPLNATVHGEQFLVSNARSHGETELVAIAVSAAPCGHCRQVLNELEEAGKLTILYRTPGPNGKTNDITTNLATLLPESFGPKDLGLKGGLLTPIVSPQSNHADALTAKAIDAARSS